MSINPISRSVYTLPSQKPPEADFTDTFVSQSSNFPIPVDRLQKMDKEDLTSYALKLTELMQKFFNTPQEADIINEITNVQRVLQQKARILTPAEFDKLQLPLKHSPISKIMES